MIPYATGIVLGLLTGLIARLGAFDRDRSFYPTVMIVIAWYYVLFAVMGGSQRAILVESIGMVVFTCLALVGARSSLWIVAGALAGHGIFDSVHRQLITNPGVPLWWEPFCMTIDLVLAGLLSWLLYTRGVPIRPVSRDASSG